MRRIAVSLFMLLVLGLVACSPTTPTIAPTTVPNDTDTPVVVETATLAETATSAAAESPTAEATQTTTTSSGAVTISTSTNAAMTEPFLVDDQGRVLYLFTNDTQNSGVSSCTGDCLAAWPAVVVTGTPTAGTGVDAAMFGTITRDDGTMQATYNGWPLYYYVDDVAPGDMFGQGMNDVWFLVSGTGNAIQP